MKFTPAAEQWNVYHLEDGTEIRVRVLLCSVVKRDGQFQENGQPVYDLGLQQIVHIEAPEHLRAAATQAPSTATKQ